MAERDSRAIDPMLGKVFEGSYRIESVLGQGGMGAVYRARHLAMERDVAIKVVRDRAGFSGGDTELLQRFEREMRATAAIKHPNTVEVYDFGHTEDNQLYLVMELLSGWTLDDVIVSHAPMSVDRAIHIGMQVALALAAAHAHGIVHRDLKPANIVLLDRYEQRDFVKVIDFGLARLQEDARSVKLTASDMRVGTPICMAPEYISAGKVDHRADLYALGVVMYEMLAGKPPFDGAPYEVMVSHVQDPVPPLPAELRVPPWLEQIVRRLLEKNPAQRYQSAKEVIAALAAPPRRRLPMVALAVVVMFVTALTLGGALLTWAIVSGAPDAMQEALLREALADPVVVVAPFVGIGHDPAAEALAVRLHKEVVLDLGATEGLAVAPQGAVHADAAGAWDYEDGEITAVLEGSVGPVEGGLQVTLRLLDAHDAGHRVLWSEAYQLPPQSDPAHTAADIAERVRARLQGL